MTSSNLSIRDKKKQAQTLIQQNQLEQARVLYSQICATDGQDAEAWFFLGAINDALKQFDEAISCCRRAVELRPRYADAHLTMGNAYKAMGHLEEAVAAYRQALAAKPSHAGVSNNLGNVLMVLGRTDEAIVAYRKALDADPRYAEAHNNLGTALKKQGRLDDAITCFRKALRLKPEYAVAHNNLGNALKDMGNLDEALACYQQALRFNPRYAEAHNNLGTVLKTQGKPEEAIASYQRALQIDPYHVYALNNLGNIYQDMRRLDEAQACYRRALQIKPDFAKAHNNLGNTLDKLNKRQEAVKCYREALRFDPEYVEAYSNLGAVLAKEGQFEEAKECCQKALQFQPDYTMPRYLLAVLGGGETPRQAPLDYVKELFDDYSERFDESLVGQLQYRGPELIFQAVQKAIDLEAATLDVLDLGCGTGLCGLLFRNFARTLVGVDLSPKMIEKARSRKIYDELVMGDISSLPVSSGKTYDLIVAGDVFIYIGDLSPAFATCSSVLKPGGLLAFSTEPGEDSETFALRTTGRYVQSAGYIRTLAAANGLEEVSMDRGVLRMEKEMSVSGHIFVLRKLP